MPKDRSRGQSRRITLDWKGGVHKGVLCEVGGKGGPVRGGEPLETLSKGKRQFIVVYCTATKPPTNISLKKKLVGNWSLKKLNSRKLGGLGGDVLSQFGTFWLAYKEGSILSGRTTKDTSDLTDWLMEKYPELRKQLLEPLYDEILKEEERDKRWRLIGDEAFHEGLLRYIWIVVPPNINLKSGPFGYHARDDPEDEKGQRKRLLVELMNKADASVSEEMRVQIHVFHGGRKKPNEVEYTLSKLPYTIPLMMEAIRCSAGVGSEEVLELQILPEGYSSGGSSRGNEFGPLITSYVSMGKVEARPRFETKPVGNWQWLEKDEHPYMAYPDAVGFELHPWQSEGNLRSDLNDIVINWDFEQAKKLSNGLLNPKNLDDAKKFYTALRNLDEESLVRKSTLDSIIRNYSNNLIKDLKVQDFIDFEKSPRGIPNYQYASSRMVEDRGGIQSWINETDDGAYGKLFELNISGLAYANRRSDGKKIQAHIEENIRISNADESDIPLDRIEKFRHLAEAASHRLFDFDMIEFGSLDDIAERAFGPDTNRDKRNYLGLRLLKEAYRDGPEVRPRILEYQKKLLDYPGDRDPNYYLEMLIDLSRGKEDSKFIGEAVDFYEDYPKEVSLWGMATRMKLGVELSRKNRDIPDSILELIDDIPKKIDTRDDVRNNPIVRCWSWGARLCDIRGMTTKRDALFDALCSRAEDAIEIEGRMGPFKDALGLTHACHILDLEGRGWERISTGEKIGNKYLDLVLKNSLKTTRDWYENNNHEDDPLKPLNLMHR